MAEPNKEELLSFYRAFGRMLDGPARKMPGNLDELIRRYDMILSNAAKRPGRGRPPVPTTPLREYDDGIF